MLTHTHAHMCFAWNWKFQIESLKGEKCLGMESVCNEQPTIVLPLSEIIQTQFLLKVHIWNVSYRQSVQSLPHSSSTISMQRACDESRHVFHVFQFIKSHPYILLIFVIFVFMLSHTWTTWEKYSESTSWDDTLIYEMQCNILFIFTAAHM
jgi:hypothetical protein